MSLSSDKPKFTIVIPAYNAADWIHISLDSLKKQTFTNFEVLVINDGSKDNTASVAQFNINGLNGRVITKPNGHWGSVLNYVVKNNLIKGDYVTFLNSDDQLAPKCLEELSLIKKDIIVTNISYNDGRKRKLKVMPGKKGDKHLSRIFTPYSGPQGKFYRKELFMSGFTIAEDAIFQDGVLYNQLASKCRSFYYVKKTLAVWGRNDDLNNASGEWNIDEVATWLEMCDRVIKQSFNYESTSWVLMKLKELADHYHGQVPFRVRLNKRKVHMLWMPSYKRRIAKMWYLLKTRRFRK